MITGSIPIGGHPYDLTSVHIDRCDSSIWRLERIRQPLWAGKLVSVKRAIWIESVLALVVRIRRLCERKHSRHVNRWDIEITTLRVKPSAIPGCGGRSRTL